MKKLNELQSYLTRLRGLMLTLIILCSIGSGNVWGAEGDLITSVTPTSDLASGTTYQAETGTNWAVNVTNNSAFGTNAKSGNDAKLKLSNNSSTSSRNTAIASALASYTGGTFTVETQYVAALIGLSSISNVGKVGVTYSGTNGGNPADMWVLYTTNSGTSYTVAGHNTSSVSSGTNITFSTIASAQYAVVFKRTGAFGLKGATISFYEGAGAAPAYTITATRNNDLYGTVSVTGTTITATPAAGYKVMSGASGYTVVSGTATVTNNGDNTFTVSPSSDCTIRINFEAKGCTDHAGTNVTSGASTEDDYGPVCAYNNYSTRQILYTRTDLNLAAGKKGTIKSIYFEYAGGDAMAARTIKIYMANTALTALSTSNCVPYASFSLVYDGSFSCSSAGWCEITLDSPFEYNGIGNLVVLIDDNTGSWASSKTFKYHEASTTTKAQIYYNNDGTNKDPSTTNWSDFDDTNYRPNTKFCILEADMVASTVTLMDNGATLTEVSAGAGVTLPSRSGCEGYTFAGWTKSWVAAQDDWTTTAPVIIPAGSYTPTTNESLYPVYTKTEGSGGVSSTDTETGKTATPYVQNTGWTASAGGTYTSAGNFGDTSPSIKMSSDGNWIASPTYSDAITDISFWYKPQNATGSISIFVSTDGDSWTELTGEAVSFSGSSTADTKSVTVSAGNNYKAVKIVYNKTTSNVAIDDIAITHGGGSVTSYISVPNCCTELATINGSFSFSETSSSITVTVPSDYSDKDNANLEGYIFKRYTASTGGEAAETIETNSSSGTSATFNASGSGLAASTTYYFTIIAKHSSSSCNSTESSPRQSHATADPPCTAPHHVTISGRWDRFGGETISLTATAYSSAGSGSPIAAGNITGYQWQKYVGSEWVNVTNGGNISGATTNNLVIANCAGSNSGSYQCVVSTGATCSTVSNDIEVKVYILECYTDGTTVYNFTRTGDSQAGTLTINLSASTAYTFKVHADNVYYGNNASINEDVSNYVFCNSSNGGNCASNFTINSGLGGTFTIGIDYSTGGNSNVEGEPEISVTYPRKTIYLTPGVWNVDGAKFAFYYFRDGGSSGWTGFITANDCGSSADIPQWNGIKIDAVRLKNTCTSPNWGDQWDGKQTNDITVTSDNSVTITGWNRSDYTYGTYSVPTYTITYATGNTTHTSGNAISGSHANDTKTCGSALTLPAAQFTTIGYTQTGWSKTDGGSQDVALSGSYTDNAAQTFYPAWTVNTHSLSWVTDGDALTGTYTSGTVAYGTTITPPDTPTKLGCTFAGWHDGTSVVTPSTMPDNNVTYTATWTTANYNITWSVNGTATTSLSPAPAQTGSSNADYGTKVNTLTLPTAAFMEAYSCGDKVFVGWTTATPYNALNPLFKTAAEAGNDLAITGTTTFYAVFADVSAAYNLVESDLGATNWAGDYLIAYSDDIFADGHLGGTGSSDAGKGIGAQYSSVDPDDNLSGKVVDATWGDTHNVTLELVTNSTNTYVLKTKDGKYNYQSSNANGLNATETKGTAESYPISVTFTSSADIKLGLGGSATGAVFRYNTAGYFRFYKDCGQQAVYLYKKSSTYSNYSTTCVACEAVTVAYNAAPTGATVSVKKGSTDVAANGTVNICGATVDLTVKITPASHYTLTGFTATGLTTGSATISPSVGTALPTTSEQTFTVQLSADATGTVTLTPTLVEDAHKVISWVVHGGSASIADGHGTTWVYSGEDLTAIPTAPDAPTGCDDKVFVGWSENDGGATEGDASDYTDLFTTLGGAPTGITTDKTFTAVFATPAAGMGGTVIWDEPFDGDAGDQPSSPTSGATVYGSASIAYNCASTTYCKLYTDNLASGGAASPELLIPKSSRSEAFEVTGIPTAGQTELTLTYMAKDALNVTTGTSGVTVGDASVEGKLYTRTITIDQSGLGVATFGLTFAKSTDSNSRLDDIHLEVPGSSSMSGYVTTCEDTWTITYYKNTEDAVTNLPSPTGISKSTGSGTLSSKVPVRYGYTFDGWATSAGGSVAYAAGAAVSSVSADMDLYAKWSVTPVTEINLSKTSLDKYVGDPSVILSVLSVLPDGANTSVTWSSSNPSVATVNSTTGEVNFVAVGTANIIATSTITSGTTATCVVTVWAKPTVSFLDNLHSLTEDKDGNALSSYNITDVAGTPVVFPVLANQPAGSGTCEDEFYVFIGWTTSDNNTDPEDHLVTSHNLTNGDNITYYAVWANGVAGTTYTKLTSSTFKTTPTHYVLGAEYNGTTKYFYSCEKTDKNNSWGYVTADLANNSPIEFTLSGTAAALVATSTEVSARYLKPMAEKDFQMSASSQTVELKSDGTIYNPVSTSWKLLYNNANSLRWYDSNISGSANAYFYEVVAGGEVNYRTSCCADKVAAPSVTATKTSTTVTLTWAAVSGATGYELQWNGGAWTAATSGVVKSDLTPNTNYSWRVRATYNAPKCGADIASGSTTTNQVYHVTYAKGSGTGSCNATGSTTDGTAYEAGAMVTLQSNGFTLVGHTFNEWTEDDEDITISSNQFTMPEHDVVITATWTPKVDKFYDRMHDGTDASHGGIADGDGKYYITREGCSYTVPSLTDNTSGATACHTKHYVLMGWTAESHLNSDGTLKAGHEGNVYTGGGTQTATGATYYAVWAEVTE